MSKNVRKIVFGGVIAGLYAALTMSLSFISYGPVQFRIAEALCVLPFFFPFTVPGLFIGCIASNMLSPYPLDIIAGSGATLIAVCLTMFVGKMYREHSFPSASQGAGKSGFVLKIIACAPPVIVNAVIIGALIGFYEAGFGEAFLPAMLISGLQVGFGELVVMYALGLPLLMILPKTKLFETLSKISGV